MLAIDVAIRSTTHGLALACSDGLIEDVLLLVYTRV